MTKDERQAALNEVKVLAMLDNPNIIKYYENYLEDKALMIVMEYAPGNKSMAMLPKHENKLTVYCGSNKYCLKHWTVEQIYFSYIERRNIYNYKYFK